MIKFICALLLLSPVGMGEVVAIHFPRLNTPLAQLIYVIITVLALAGVWYAYRHEASYVSPKRKRILASLRSASVIILLFISTGAFLELEREQDAKGRFLMLVDQSASMDRSDRRTLPEELDEARVLVPDLTQEQATNVSRVELLRGAFAHADTDLISLIGEKFSVEAYGFGQASTLTPIELAPLDSEGGRLGAMEEPTDGSTQMSSALSDAVRRAKGRAVDGIIMYSDGNWNRGEDPVEVAQTLGIPVHTVGVGLPRSRDLEVAFVFTEDVVFKNDRVQLETRLRSYGYNGRSAKLLIKQVDQQGTEELIKEEQVELGEGGDLTHVVEIVPDREGTFTFIAELEAFPDEPNTLNNRRSKANVRVLDRKIRVLMVEDSPRWEYRFIQHILESDRQRMSVTSILRQGDERGANQVRHFPGTINELRKYDCVIIGDMLAEFFTPEELRVLEEWVRVDGGGLILIAGRRAMPSGFTGTPIEALMPVECDALPPPTIQDEMSGTISLGFRMQRAPDADRIAAMRLAPEVDENNRLWNESSEIFWHIPVSRLKSGATAWFNHPTSKLRDDTPMPLVASQRYGRGQSVFFATDETWRWRFKPGSSYHRRFWGQLVTGLSMGHVLGGSSRSQLETDRAEYGVGDHAQVIARVLDQDYNPLLSETVSVSVEQGGLARESMTLVRREDQPGVYVGEWIPAEEGRFELRLDSTAGDGGDMRMVDVVASRLEADDGGMREDILQQIAQVSGGTYTRLSDVPKLAERLTSQEREGAVRREEKTLWNAPGVLLLLVLCLGLEWFIRKRSDLL